MIMKEGQDDCCNKEPMMSRVSLEWRNQTALVPFHFEDISARGNLVNQKRGRADNHVRRINNPVATKASIHNKSRLSQPRRKMPTPTFS